MLESPLRQVELRESAADYQQELRARNNRILLFTVLLMLFCVSVYLILGLVSPKTLPYAPILSISFAAIVALPIWIWNEPRRGFYLLTFCASFCPIIGFNVDRDPFARIPYWWNIGSTVLYYTNSSALMPLHFSLADVTMALTILFWLIRNISLKQLKINRGVIWPSLAAYSVFCLWGFFYGLSKGGPVEVALAEIRAQIYFCAAYLMGTNLIQNRKQAMTILWLLMISIGVRCVLGTMIYLANPNVSADEGLLTHEDSLLVNVVIYGAILLNLARIEPKLKWFCTALAPFAILTSLGNGRRAGIASLLVALPVIIMLCAVLLRERRKALLTFIAAMTVVAAIYLPLAWNSNAAWALPARAIRSQSSPDPRDASSDTYRLNENANLRLTRDTSPLLGYGFGLEYIHPFPQPGRLDVFTYILPHNGILWIWMRLGHIGFLLFWLFVAAVLTRGSNLLKAIRDPRLQTIGILAIATFLMLIIYGQYDLSFTNFRTMWVAGTLIGMLAALPRISQEQQGEEADSNTPPTDGGEEAEELDVEIEDDNPLAWETPSRRGSKRWERVTW